MNQLKKALVTLFLLGFLQPLSVFAKNDTFTIYLVRHAEKQKEPTRDPQLTECGTKRAENLAKQLAGTKLTQVFSTNYQRTMETALPTAKAHQLMVTQYDPRNLEALSASLLHRKENTLVVGHSNTTNVVAGLLAHQQVPQLDESEFDFLFKVSVENGEASLTRIDQGFVCQ